MTPTRMWAVPLVVLLGGCGFQAIPRTDNAVASAWAEVQNQYQRRADLVPNLVETVKGYATHERETLEGVISARAKATQIQLRAEEITPENLRRFEQAQGELSRALGRLMVVSEQYPQLRANENFKDLQVQIEGTENRIATARRRYIETVQEFNNLVTVPPTSWTNALLYKKQPKAQFTATVQGAEQAPRVKF